jgi:hypothetical protein
MEQNRSLFPLIRLPSSEKPHDQQLNTMRQGQNLSSATAKALAYFAQKLSKTRISG